MSNHKIHYAGAIETPSLKILPGWAACCSGRRADSIRDAGHNTYDPALVTCKNCKRMLERAAKDSSFCGLQYEDPCALGYE